MYWLSWFHALCHYVQELKEMHLDEFRLPMVLFVIMVQLRHYSMHLSFVSMKVIHWFSVRSFSFSVKLCKIFYCMDKTSSRQSYLYKQYNGNPWKYGFIFLASLKLLKHLTLLMPETEYCGFRGQHHTSWCTGNFRSQCICRHGIDCVG